MKTTRKDMELLARLSTFTTPERIPMRLKIGEQAIQGIPSRFVPQITKRSADTNMRMLTVSAKTEEGLRILVEYTEYTDYPMVEWVAFITNEADTDSPILSDWHIGTCVIPGTHPVLVHGNGDTCRPDGYTWRHDPLNAPHTVAPCGDGTPCNGAFPYLRLLFDDWGVNLACGWSGQWQADFAPTGNGVSVSFGQQTFRTYLKPGETVRTPRVNLMAFAGGEDRGRNLWRSFYFAHMLPRANGQPLDPKLVLHTWMIDGKPEFTGVTEENQIKAIDTYLEHGYQPDIWWIDAGWYPCNFNWPTIGSWVCNPEHFPHSMKPVADHCAANNIDLLVWFEPERVLVGTEIDLEHPDFLLYYTGENEWLRQNRLLNLGNPRALAWITDRINKLIRENGIRIYRQDFNFPPMPYWQENTEKDRDGILENLHIQGYYAFWDALLDRNPGLWIDSCASGGRRNDPETMRRAVPLHYTDVGYGNHPIKQKQHREMFEWIPYFRAHTYNWDEPDGSYGTTNHKLDEFAFQNAMTPCVTSMVEYYDSDELYALGLRMEPIWRKAAELELCGDYYPLTACNADTHDWYAMQFDDPDNRSGFVQLIRNTQAPDDSLCVSFHVEDTAATYRFDNPLSGETLQIQGKELLNGLSGTLEKRTAIILFYKY